jgi:hypothetical protein
MKKRYTEEQIIGLKRPGIRGDRWVKSTGRAGWLRKLSGLRGHRPSSCPARWFLNVPQTHSALMSSLDKLYYQCKRFAPTSRPMTSHSAPCPRQVIDP